MESEIIDEICECSGTSLHACGEEIVLNKENELLKDNFYEKGTKLIPIQAIVDAQGQVVPAHSPSCLKPENEASQNNEHSTVPQGTLEVKECSKESEYLSKIHHNEFLAGKGLGKLTSTLSVKGESITQENAMKTFLWPPIGFKENIRESIAPINDSGTLEQAVLRRKDEKNITIPKELPIVKNVNQSEEHSSQEEEKNKLTSILKKSDNGLKKAVHFPKNIVSVKFYDISDEEESDNDTEILSDPEEEDLKDQEVPLNTYDDYDPDCCHPTSMNFIPQFTFPPILKIANCHLYENIDDHDEQIMAIMEDDDGRKRLYANDLAADEIYHQEDTSGFEGGVPTSQEVIVQSENPEEAPSEIIATRKPIIKNGIEQNEENLEMNGYRNMAGSFKFENLEVNLQTLAKDKTTSETAKKGLDVHFPIADTGTEQQNQNDQQTSVKIKTIFEKPEEIEMNIPVTNAGIEQLVREKSTNEYKSDEISKEITSFENLAEGKEIEEVHRLAMQNKVQPLEDDLQINEYVESESSVVKENPLVLAISDQRNENPAVIHENSSCANETNFKVNESDVKVYTLPDALKATPSISVESVRKQHPVTCFTEENFVQQATSPKRTLEGKNASMISLPEREIPEFHAQQLHKMQTELPKPDMVKKWLLATQNVVSHDDTSTMADATFGTTENVDLLANEISKENMVKKQEATSILQNDVFAVSNENAVGCTATQSSARAFHGNCGSNFLWRGSRSISNMILDENFQVPIGPIAKNEISYPLAKEEITFSKAAIFEVKYLESNIIAAATAWGESVATEPGGLEEVKLKKYDHSFLSSPDHLNEFEELEQSASETDFPNKKQTGKESCTSNIWLKRNNFGIGESVEQYKTGLYEQQIVPDTFVQDQLKSQPMKESPRAVPSSADNIVTMDTTNSLLHLDDYPQQNPSTLKNHEFVKKDSVITPVSGHQDLSNSQTAILATQGRRKLRVGLSKSTRVKSLHPYWSKGRIKQSGSIS